MCHLIGVRDVVFFKIVCITKEDKSIRQQATTPIGHQNYTVAKDQSIVPRNIQRRPDLKCNSVYPLLIFIRLSP